MAARADPDDGDVVNRWPRATAIRDGVLVALGLVAALLLMSWDGFR